LDEEQSEEQDKEGEDGRNTGTDSKRQCDNEDEGEYEELEGAEERH
jgi:hypothetical protein